MSDDQQPTFFGGLPPRPGAATSVQERPSAAQRPSPVDPGDEKKRNRRTIFLLIGGFLVVLAAVLIAVNMATTAMAVNAAKEERAELQKVIEKDAVKEAVKAEEIIAEGGGAVKGHVVNPELCTAMDSFVAAGGEAVGTGTLSPELLAATEALAAIQSPNQVIYQSYVALQKDPASIPSIADASAVAVDFVNAAQADLVTCM